jgi:hypothetical protein
MTDMVYVNGEWISYEEARIAKRKELISKMLTETSKMCLVGILYISVLMILQPDKVVSYFIGFVIFHILWEAGRYYFGMRKFYNKYQYVLRMK